MRHGALGVRGVPAVSHLADSLRGCDPALQCGVEPHTPNGGAPLEQALAFAAAGPVDGRVVRELGVLEEANGGDSLCGVQALFGSRVALR